MSKLIVPNDEGKSQDSVLTAKRTAGLCRVCDFFTYIIGALVVINLILFFLLFLPVMHPYLIQEPNIGLLLVILSVIFGAPWLIKMRILTIYHESLDILLEGAEIENIGTLLEIISLFTMLLKEEDKVASRIEYLLQNTSGERKVIWSEESMHIAKQLLAGPIPSGKKGICFRRQQLLLLPSLLQNPSVFYLPDFVPSLKNFLFLPINLSWKQMAQKRIQGLTDSDIRISISEIDRGQTSFLRIMQRMEQFENYGLRIVAIYCFGALPLMLILIGNKSDSLVRFLLYLCIISGPTIPIWAALTAASAALRYRVCEEAALSGNFAALGPIIILFKITPISFTGFSGASDLALITLLHNVQDISNVVLSNREEKILLSFLKIDNIFALMRVGQRRNTPNALEQRRMALLQRAAASACGALCGASAIPGLERCISDEPDRIVQEYARLSLKQIKSRMAGIQPLPISSDIGSSSIEPLISVEENYQT